MDAPLVDKVHQSIQSSLRNFTFDTPGADGSSVAEEPYIDSLVLHSPLDTMQDTLAVWTTLESYTPHAIRNLGISNVTLPVLKLLCEEADLAVRPAVVQNRFHDRTAYEVDLRALCRNKDIVFQSFWTLSANPSLARSRPVASVARAAGVEVPAAYYALVLGLEGVTVLDGTTDETHMVDDLQGLETVGEWSEGPGKDSWRAALGDFRALIGDS